MNPRLHPVLIRLSRVLIVGLQRWQRYISPDGKRQDAAHCYIHPLLQGGQHPNLHILVNSKVIRVIFDEQQSPPCATGVEYLTNPEHIPAVSLPKPAVRSVRAVKLVVVSAGALGSPQILERSGIGNLRLLEKLKIKTISDLPGVGENYQDHHLTLHPYKSNLDPGQTLDGLFSSRKDFSVAVKERDPLVGWNGIGECCFRNLVPYCRYLCGS